MRCRESAQNTAPEVMAASWAELLGTLDLAVRYGFTCWFAVKLGMPYLSKSAMG